MSDSVLSDTEIAKSIGNIPLSKGLVLRKGTKKSTFQLRVTINGKRTTQVIGHYPQMSVAEAIDTAKLLRSGKTPEPLLIDLLTRYVDDHPIKSNEDTLRAILKHFGELLTKKPSQISTKEVMALAKGLELNAATKKKLFSFANKASKWGEVLELAPNCFNAFVAYDSSLRGDRKILRASTPKQRVIPLAVLDSTFQSMRRQDDKSILTILLLLGLRKEEARFLKKSEVDFEQNTITIPGERRKSGNPLTLPMPPLVVRHVSKACAASDSCYVFPRIASESHASLAARVKRHSKGHTPHDYRSTMSKMLMELGVEQVVISSILGHTIANDAPVVTRVYTGGPTDQHVYSDNSAKNRMASKLEALEKLEEFLKSKILLP